MAPRTLPANLSSDRNQLVAFVCAYAALLAVLLPRIPLWMDEQLDLVTVRSPDPTAIFAQIRGVLGSAPLPQLLQWASFRIFGQSAVAGRLPSALASIGACLGVYFLARLASLPRPVLAVLTFAAIPLQFRYALEARGYAIALCFSVWASVVFLRAVQADRSPAGRFAWYALLLAAALYAQPYAGFVAAAHWLWAMRWGSRRVKLLATGAVLASALLFLPWYLYASPWWKQVLPVIKGAYHFSPGSVLLVVHELVGMGYPGTILVLAGCAAGVVHTISGRHDSGFWLLYAAVPIAAALVADAAFAYFLAIRQILFIVAPLAILFTAGIEAARKWKPLAGLALALIFFGGAIYANARFYARPRQVLPELQQQLELR